MCAEIVELPVNLRYAHTIARRVRDECARERRARARAVCAALRAWRDGASASLSVQIGIAAGNGTLGEFEGRV